MSVFRTGLGRDPGPTELATFVPLVRDRLPMTVLAERVVETPEFRRRHAGDSSETLVATLLHNAFGHAQAVGRPTFSAELGWTPAELVALVAELALARGAIPLLPGLAPGTPPDDPVGYRLWVQEYDTPDESALARVPTLVGPRISIAISAGDTQAEALERTVQSLRGQVYRDWELCLVARPLSPWARDVVEQLVQEEPRIRLLGAGTLQEALMSAAGLLCCLLEPGDQLAPSALYEVAAEFATDPEAALLYTDEDVIEASIRRSPRLKPAFSPDATFSGDLIGQLAVYRTELIREIGGLPAGSRPMRDLVCRAVAAAGPTRIRHLPAVLCHRGQDPPGLDVEARLPAPSLREPAPTVTVIVLTKDRPGLLRVCLQGVLDRTAYPNLELLLVDNGTTEAEAVSLLEAAARRPGVRVLPQPGPFNFAAFNNQASAQARGDVLVLLNNDIEVLDEGWLGAMIAQVMRPDVGVVGARLLYPDGKIQHAGILLGPDGSATHVGRGARADDPGYLGQLASVRDLSAVTGACMAIRKSTWSGVGGMDERLAVTWNDVDFCLRVRRAGLRVIWTPDATLIHREGSTRGLEAEDPTRERRFDAERAIVRATWGEAACRDPFLNANLIATEAGRLALSPPRLRRPQDRTALHHSGKDGISPECAPSSPAR